MLHHVICVDVGDVQRLLLIQIDAAEMEVVPYSLGLHEECSACIVQICCAGPQEVLARIWRRQYMVWMILVLVVMAKLTSGQCSPDTDSKGWNCGQMACATGATGVVNMIRGFGLPARALLLIVGTYDILNRNIII